MKRWIVHTRIYVMRGQGFVGMIFSTLAVTALYRDHFPGIPMWIIMLGLGSCYLGLAWMLGYVDDKSRMSNLEQKWFGDRNPVLDQILKEIRNVKYKLEKPSDRPIPSSVDLYRAGVDIFSD
jgi:hypothetical protein